MKLRKVAMLLALCLVANTALARPRKHRSRKKRHKTNHSTEVIFPATPAKPAPGLNGITGDQTAANLHEERTTVRVIDVAGDFVYVEPGSDQGLVRDSIVAIGGKRLRVFDSTKATAVVRAPNGSIAVGDTGIAQVFVETDKRPPGPPKVRPISAFQDQWTKVVLPATTQHPKSIPLDTNMHSSNQRVFLSAGITSNIPTDLGIGAVTRLETRGRVHVEPVSGTPMNVDADVALQKWLGRDLLEASASRSLLRVYQLELGYGRSADFNAAMGRLRYASTTIGQLDGVRLQTPSFHGFSLAGFGGLLPDPMSGGVSLNAQRFGVEALYTDPESALAPLASLTLHGSVYQGSIDERRANGSVYFFPKKARFGGFFEFQWFNQNNPWNAAPFELTAAGVDGALHFDSVSVGVRADMRTPERSNWLASYFPASYLCIAQPPTSAASTTASGGIAPDPCGTFSQSRYTAMLDATVHAESLLANFGAQVIQSSYQTQPDQYGGFANIRFLNVFTAGRIEASANILQGTWLHNYVARIGIGADLFDNVLDFSAYYRPALIKYVRVSNETWIEHAIGTTLWFALNDRLSLQMAGEAIQGYDVGVLLLQSFITWRPL